MKHSNSYNQALEIINEDNKTIHETLMQLKQELMEYENIDNDLCESLTFGQKLADKVALFGGSWWFIIIFILTIVVWIILNSLLLIVALDPFPYILLNLALSCIAALQAPVIMMSQNRQESKDRVRAELDCRINLVLLRLNLDMNERLIRIENKQIDKI